MLKTIGRTVQQDENMRRRTKAKKNGRFGESTDEIGCLFMRFQWPCDHFSLPCLWLFFKCLVLKGGTAVLVPCKQSIVNIFFPSYSFPSNQSISYQIGKHHPYGLDDTSTPKRGKTQCKDPNTNDSTNGGNWKGRGGALGGRRREWAKARDGRGEINNKHNVERGE